MIMPKVFTEWFAERYPKIAASMKTGEKLAPNELWLYNAVKEAYEAGQLSPNIGDMSELQWER